MARETTIRLDFMLEKAKKTKVELRATPPAITAGASTIIESDPTDPGWSTDPVTYRVGELLYVSGTGWASLDDQVHMITAANSTTGEITIATDTSAETAPLAATADINVQAFEWDHVCLSEFTPNPGAPGEIDVTTMCDTERRNLPGLPTPGTASFTGMFDLEDTGMAALIAAQKDALDRYFVGTSRRGQMAVFHGVVSSFAPGPMTVEAALTFVGTLTLDESPYYMVNPALVSP